MKKFTASVVVLACLLSICFYSVVSAAVTNKQRIDLGMNAKYELSKYLSSVDNTTIDKKGVHSVTVDLNKTKLVFGYGQNGIGSSSHTTVDKMGNNLINKGYNVIAGINGDFFDHFPDNNTDYGRMYNGTTMGQAISDGNIIAATSESKSTFMTDYNDKAAIGKMYFRATMDMGGTKRTLSYVNKNAAYERKIYMFTPLFGQKAYTHKASGKADRYFYFAVCTPLNGSTDIGAVSSLSYKMDSITAEAQTGEFQIPAGKVVIAFGKDVSNISDIKNFVGKTFKIDYKMNASSGSTKLGDIKFAVGGDDTNPLIDNGKVMTNDSIDYRLAKRPRTAIGITSDGKVILSCTDKNPGLSIGGLAQMMKELGCVNAMNLDGGGSSQMALREPGESSLKLVSEPAESNNTYRKVASGIFVAEKNKTDIKPSATPVVTPSPTPIKTQSPTQKPTPTPTQKPAETTNIPSPTENKTAEITPTGTPENTFNSGTPNMNTPNESQTPTVTGNSASPTEDGVVQDKEEKSSNWLLIVLVSVIAAAAIAVSAFFIIKKIKKA